MAPRVTLALALLLSSLALRRRHALRSGSSPTPPRDVEALLREMTLDEKVGQMAQADRSHLRSEADIRGFFLGSLLSGGGSSPPDKTAPGWAEMYDRYQSVALQTRLAGPARLRHRRRPRPQQRGRGRRLPPQHRPRLHARRRARRARGAGHRRGGRGHRHRLDLLALHRGRARRALGTDVRELRRDARARLGDGRGRGARLPAHRSWPAPSTTSPTAARPAAATRATRRWTRRPCGRSTCPATARRSRPASAR